MDNQNNYYPQQPQYIDPQAYTPAPLIPDQLQPAAPAEPEVILQEVGFADYGFGEGDSVTTGHDFGNIMDDDNTEPAEDDFNIFNSQTPNFDPAAVEAASKTNLDAEKAIFTATTPNFDPASVAAASSAGSASDREIFSGNFAVGQMQQTVSETPTFDAATAALDREEAQIPKTEINPAPPAFEAAPAAPVIPASDFLASMQGMFASMNGTAPAVPAAPAAPAPAPAEPAAPVAPAIAAEPVIPAAPAAPVAPAEPVIPAAPAAPVAPPPAPAPVFENDLVPDELMPGANEVKAEPEFDLVPDEFLEAEAAAAAAPDAPVQPAQPDMVANASAYSTIHDISSTAAPAAEQEKGVDYWNNIDQMLGNFEQKPAAHAEPAAPAPNPVTPPPINEEKGGFPFSGGAQANDAKPAAPVINTIATTPVPAATAAVAAPAEAESDEEIEDDFIASAREKRAAKKAEKDAKKAAKKAAAEEAKAEPAAPAAEPSSYSESDAPSGFKGILYRIFPNRNDSVGGIIRKCVSVLAAIALIVCAVYFLHAFISSKSQAKDAKKLADIMASSENSAAAWEDIYKKYPNINFPTGMQAKFADLYAMNQDLIGWIRIPGLGIDYPVVQAKDDNYYLKRDFHKQSSAYGTVFLSSKNQYKEGLDLNTVIYGHAMRRDKQMFSRLHDYKDSSTFVQNPIIEFNTLFANYKFKVYCVFLTNGSSAQDNGYLFDYTFPNLASVESFAGFVAEANQRKLYATGTDILPTDKIICLSTCSYEFDNARFVVVGRMLRAGESEEIDSSKVEANKNPRYPQAWYDSNKKTNPYASYSHWKPTY
ncbi:MAG: class B sortase [Clostridia bacterium]|nr:class B sortase [Clostridia bacterium]